MDLVLSILRCALGMLAVTAASVHSAGRPNRDYSFFGADPLLVFVSAHALVNEVQSFGRGRARRAAPARAEIVEVSKRESPHDFPLLLFNLTAVQSAPSGQAEGGNAPMTRIACIDAANPIPARGA